MLGHYIGGCMVSISNINNGIKEPTHGYQICNTNHIFILGVYLRPKKIFVYPSYYLDWCHSKPY